MIETIRKLTSVHILDFFARFSSGKDEPITLSCCKDDGVLPPLADLSPDSVSGLRNCRTSMSVAVKVVAAICPSWPGPVMEMLESASTIPTDEFVSVADGLETVSLPDE